MAKKGLGKGLESIIPISSIQDRSYVMEVEIEQLTPIYINHDRLLIRKK